MNYYTCQQAVYDHLLQKHRQDPAFTFSVRKVFTKGRERNYFIGTEKSGYFGFTLWDISSGYPGAAIELMCFLVKKITEVDCRLEFQYYTTKQPPDHQNEVNLLLREKLRKTFKNAGVDFEEDDSENKMAWLYVQHPDRIPLQKLPQAVETFINDLAPAVDQAIGMLKQSHPDWQAGRITKKDFDFYQSNLNNNIKQVPGDSGGKLLDDTTIQTEVPARSPYPLNVILFGPPGTGKTYSSIDLAVKIIGLDAGDHDKNQKTFKQHLGDQIEFVTFHQSYSYEDFIQGLKPDADGENGQLSFRLRDGIFKKLADRALAAYLTPTGDSRLPDFTVVLDRFLTPVLENGVEIPVKLKEVSYYVTGADRKATGEGKINYRQHGGTQTSLEIKTLRHLYEEKIKPVADDSFYYYIPLLKELQSIAQSIRQVSQPTIKNFVLIIDEINRANISRVFGELITLIEEDKRFGRKNEMTVTLPSGETLTVPPNLYIIGTMNTADRSIALLDIALRRRFKFQGMYPDYSLIPAFADVLQPINRAIKEKKKSADLMIGHSFFVDKPKEQLNEIFNQEIIPLLTEYFNGNNVQIAEVLATGGIKVKEDDNFQLKCERN